MNCTEPGLIDTAQIRRLFPGDARRRYAEQHIWLGDFGEPEDVRAATAFLASGPAAYITGIVHRCRWWYAILLVFSAEGRETCTLHSNHPRTLRLCPGGDHFRGSASIPEVYYSSHNRHGLE